LELENKFKLATQRWGFELSQKFGLGENFGFPKFCQSWTCSKGYFTKRDFTRYEFD